MRRLLAVVLALLAAGCTAMEAPSPAAPEPERALDAASAPAPSLIEAAPPHRALDVALTVADRWVRPQDDVVASAASTPNARIAWFLAARNPIVGNWPHRATSLDAVPAGMERAVARLDEGGRYVLAARGATLNVTVAGGLPPQADAIVDAVPTPEGIRFVPDEALAGRGGALIVRNRASDAVALAERDFLVALPVSGASVSFRMPRGIDLGDYDLVALASDGAGGVGTAAARIVFDIRKPDEAQVIGPFGGRIQLAGPAPVGDRPESHAFRTRFVMRDLDIIFNATSGVGPAAIRVALVGPDGKDVDVGEAAAEGRLSFHGLAPGAYAFRVEAVEGALMTYAVEGRAKLALTTPESFFEP